jgi:hypothetical protein
MIARAKNLTCSTVGCKGRVRGKCSMALRGVLEGKTCDRPLCDGCKYYVVHTDGQVDARPFCRAHKSGKLW